MSRYTLVAILLGAAPLSAQATVVDARNRAILAAVLREAPKEGDVWAGLYIVKGDTAVVAVMQTSLPRETARRASCSATSTRSCGATANGSALVRARRSRW